MGNGVADDHQASTSTPSRWHQDSRPSSSSSVRTSRGHGPKTPPSINGNQHTSSDRSKSRSRSRSNSSSRSSRSRKSSRDNNKRRTPLSRHRSPLRRDDRRNKHSERVGVIVRNLPMRMNDVELREVLYNRFSRASKIARISLTGDCEKRIAAITFRGACDTGSITNNTMELDIGGARVRVEPANSNKLAEIENDDRPSRSGGAPAVNYDEYHPRSCRWLYVGNMERRTNEQWVKERFSTYGHILNVDFKTDPYGASYAFVEFADIQSVCRAIDALEKRMGVWRDERSRPKVNFGKTIPSSSVWLGSLPSVVDEEYLRKKLNFHGKVTDLILDRAQSQALATFDKAEDARVCYRELKQRRARTIADAYPAVDYGSDLLHDLFLDRQLLSKTSSSARAESDRHRRSSPRARSDRLSPNNRARSRDRDIRTRYHSPNQRDYRRRSSSRDRRSSYNRTLKRSPRGPRTPPRRPRTPPDSRRMRSSHSRSPSNEVYTPPSPVPTKSTDEIETKLDLKLPPNGISMQLAGKSPLSRRSSNDSSHKLSSIFDLGWQESMIKKETSEPRRTVTIEPDVKAENTIKIAVEPPPVPPVLVAPDEKEAIAKYASQCMEAQKEAKKTQHKHKRTSRHIPLDRVDRCDEHSDPRRSATKYCADSVVRQLRTIDWMYDRPKRSIESPKSLKINFDRSGGSVSSVGDLGESIDTPQSASGSSFSLAHHFEFFPTTNIPTFDKKTSTLQDRLRALGSTMSSLEQSVANNRSSIDKLSGSNRLSSRLSSEGNSHLPAMSAAELLRQRSGISGNSTPVSDIKDPLGSMMAGVSNLFRQPPPTTSAIFNKSGNTPSTESTHQHNRTNLSIQIPSHQTHDSSYSLTKSSPITPVQQRTPTDPRRRSDVTSPLARPTSVDSVSTPVRLPTSASALGAPPSQPRPMQKQPTQMTSSQSRQCNHAVKEAPNKGSHASKSIFQMKARPPAQSTSKTGSDLGELFKKQAQSCKPLPSFKPFKKAMQHVEKEKKKEKKDTPKEREKFKEHKDKHDKLNKNEKENRRKEKDRRRREEDKQREKDKQKTKEKDKKKKKEESRSESDSSSEDGGNDDEETPMEVPEGCGLTPEEYQDIIKALGDEAPRFTTMYDRVKSTRRQAAVRGGFKKEKKRSNFLEQLKEQREKKKKRKIHLESSESGSESDADDTRLQHDDSSNDDGTRDAVPAKTSKKTSKEKSDKKKAKRAPSTPSDSSDEDEKERKKREAENSKAVLEHFDEIFNAGSSGSDSDQHKSEKVPKEKKKENKGQKADDKGKKENKKEKQKDNRQSKERDQKEARKTKKPVHKQQQIDKERNKDKEKSKDKETKEKEPSPVKKEKEEIKSPAVQKFERDLAELKKEKKLRKEQEAANANTKQKSPVKEEKKEPITHILHNTELKIDEKSRKRAKSPIGPIELSARKKAKIDETDRDSSTPLSTKSSVSDRTDRTGGTPPRNFISKAAMKAPPTPASKYKEMTPDMFNEVAHTQPVKERTPSPNPLAAGIPESYTKSRDDTETIAKESASALASIQAEMTNNNNDLVIETIVTDDPCSAQGVIEQTPIMIPSELSKEPTPTTSTCSQQPMTEQRSGDSKISQLDETINDVAAGFIEIDAQTLINMETKKNRRQSFNKARNTPPQAAPLPPCALQQQKPVVTQPATVAKPTVAPQQPATIDPHALAAQMLQKQPTPIGCQQAAIGNAQMPSHFTIAQRTAITTSSGQSPSGNVQTCNAPVSTGLPMPNAFLKATPMSMASALPNYFGAQASVTSEQYFQHIMESLMAQEIQQYAAQAAERQLFEQYLVAQQVQQRAVHAPVPVQQRTPAPKVAATKPKPIAQVQAVPASKPVPEAPQKQPQTPAGGHQDEMSNILQKYPIEWTGHMQMKNYDPHVQMHYVSGNRSLLERSVRRAAVDNRLKIHQRMKLIASQLEGVFALMQAPNTHCVFLALPCGTTRENLEENADALSTGFIHYLTDKQAAGIVNVAPNNAESAEGGYVVHIFPPCDFSESFMAQHASELLASVRKYGTTYTFVVITTVNTAT